MTISGSASSNTNRPTWFWIVAGLGLAWNVFGLVQFAGSLTSTPDSLMEAGMTPEHAAVMKGYPVWMTIAFAIGTLGGTIGCCLLLVRSEYSILVFWISLVAYVVLYIGDYTEGVFAAMGPPQVIILTIVVLIAGVLLALSRFFGNADFAEQVSVLQRRIGGGRKHFNCATKLGTIKFVRGAAFEKDRLGRKENTHDHKNNE